MMKNVTLYEVKQDKNQFYRHPDQPFLFSGGEPHINLTHKGSLDTRFFVIEVKGGNLSDLCAAIVVEQALTEAGSCLVDLFLPYMPAGRMDRQTEGQPHTLGVVVDLLSTASFDSIYTVDVHSNKTMELLSEREHVLQISPMPPPPPGTNPTDLTVVAPDAGATKRAKRVADHYGLPLVCAEKFRDPNQNFAVTKYTCPQIKTTEAWVIDDICDGGGTFIALAQCLAAAPIGAAPRLHLWVTHGIFSKGLQPLFQHYETINCSDSLNSPTENTLNRVSLLPELQKVL